jgi:hypothetical protein
LGEFGIVMWFGTCFKFPCILPKWEMVHT